MTGPVTLAGDITIDADANNTSVTFNSTATVNSDGTPRDLTINTGAGAIAMQGVIGGSAELDVISINSATTGAGTIEITNTQADGAVSIGNSNTATLTLDGTAYTTTGTNSAQTYTADDYNLTGADITFTTAAGVVTFADGGSDGSIDLSDAADLTINSTGGNIIINVPILGTAGGVSTDVTLNAVAGNVTIEDLGTDINDIAITGTTITLNGTMETADLAGTDPGDVTLTGAVVLGGSTTIDTDSGNGAISFTSTVNATNAGTETLTISSGSGAVDIAGIIGGSTAVGDIAINASAGTGTIDLDDIGDGSPAAGISGTLTVGNTNTSEVEFDGTNYDISGAILIKSASGEKIKFTDTSGTAIDFRTTGAGSTIGFNTGTIKISDRTAALEITSNNGNITIVAIEGTHDEDITINAGSGSLAVGAIGGTEVEGINTVALTSSTGITLSGGITTSNATGNNVTLTGPVIISGSVDIDTDTGTDGTIGFSSTIIGNSGTDNLTIDSGGSGITFGGTIGVTTPLTSLNINQDGGAVALTIPQIGTAGGAAGVSGATNIGTTSTATVDMSAASYKFGGTTAIKAGTASTGTTFSAADTAVDLSNANITITNAVVIADGTLDINSAGGDISITGAITSAGTDEALILDDGTGTSGSITPVSYTHLTLPTTPYV